MNFKYRHEIDSLREFAVLAVIIYHSKVQIFGKTILKGGYIGVDIFFLISGYVITNVILKEINTTNKFSYLNFLVKK